MLFVWFFITGNFIKDYKVKATLIDFNDGRKDGHFKKKCHFNEHKSEF